MVFSALRSSLLALVLTSLLGAASATEVTPLQKVIEMLNGMVAKGKQEKHDEEVEFAKFHEWCDSVRAERTKSIEQGADQIEQLSADIMKAESDAETLSAEIEDLSATIAKAEAEAAAATEVRDKEHADFKATHTDLSESIDACGRAVIALEAKSADVPQSLAQLRSAPRKLPKQAESVIESFLAMHEAQAPKANAYEFQSGGVVAMLEKLTHKFEDERLALEKAELNSKNNYEVLMQQLTDNLKQDKATSAAKTSAKASRLETAADAKSDKASTEATKAEDEKTLSDTLATCATRSTDFEKNQVTRAEEIKAIEKSTEILSSGSVTGNAETYLPAFIQARSTGRSALTQLRSGAKWDSQTRRRAVEFLQGRAKRLGSRYLLLAAARAEADPFAKVKKMIKDMIVRLMEEANAEADEKAYCDTEMATNKQTRENKATEVEELTAKVEQLTAESSKLTSEIQELSDSIAEINGQRAEATKNRAEEKATNTKTCADAKEAQTAVEMATKVLRDFYNKAKDLSLVQGEAAGLGQEMSQVTSRAPYKGLQDTSTGVFGMLEVVLSDFARLESETLASEDSSQTAHEKFLDETAESIAVKQTEVDHKTEKRDRTDETARNLKRELELTQEELDKAMDYYEKLKGDCVNTGLSYEDRVKAREEEVQSLQEALKILNQQDLA